MNIYAKLDTLHSKICQEAQLNLIEQLRKSRRYCLWAMVVSTLMIASAWASHAYFDVRVEIAAGIILPFTLFLAASLFFRLKHGKTEKLILEERSGLIQRLALVLKEVREEEVTAPIKVIRQSCDSVRLLFSREDGEYEVGVIAPPKLHFFGNAPRAFWMRPLVGDAILTSRPVAATDKDPRIYREGDEVRVRVSQLTPYLVTPPSSEAQTLESGGRKS